MGGGGLDLLSLLPHICFHEFSHFLFRRCHSQSTQNLIIFFGFLLELIVFSLMLFVYMLNRLLEKMLTLCIFIYRLKIYNIFSVSLIELYSNKEFFINSITWCLPVQVTSVLNSPEQCSFGAKANFWIFNWRQQKKQWKYRIHLGKQIYVGLKLILYLLTAVKLM